jgi:hypothetical protein
MIVGDQPRWLGSAAVRPSRRPLRGLLRIKFFFDDTINRRHPEEARSAVSKDAETVVHRLVWRD